ncbi:MAG TPA: permease [Gaiellaceae bacterium]|nr:permease [Gaiellaceae bacterium]
MIWHELWRALAFSFGMAWEILWALVLGFLLSSMVGALVSKREVERLLPDHRARSLVAATALGAASSSCSYAAVALARSLVRKGADFTAAIAFEIASTNLVLELGIAIALILGWQFTLGEFVGGPLMIVLVALLFRVLLSRRLVDEARAQAELGRLGSMEGHAAMDMSVQAHGSLWRRLRSPEGFTATSHVYVMEWAAVLRDIAIGLVVAGALAAWVPAAWWRSLFLHGHPGIDGLWGALTGPLVAMLSFVCSIGNVPLAAVLWNGGISFGGVIAFVFADLIILPIIDIYRRYYGWRMAGFLLLTLYSAIVVAGLVVGEAFTRLGLTPNGRHAKVETLSAAVSWNATTFLDLVALLVSGVLVWRFFATGGGPMLRMMEAPMDEHDHSHHHHHAHQH